MGCCSVVGCDLRWFDAPDWCGRVCVMGWCFVAVGLSVWGLDFRPGV